MKPNTTGNAAPEDYYLGRGALYFAALDANNMPLGFRFLGNAPNLGISTESETLEHFNSVSGLKAKDATVTISRNTTLSFTLEEFNQENLSDYFSGSQATHTNVSVAGFAKWTMVPATALALGRWFDIRNSTGARAYDVASAKLSIESTDVSPVSMVLDTDYTLDSKLGRIFILSSSTKMATAISGSKGLAVTLTADAAAATVNEVRAFTRSTVPGCLKFISENAQSGRRDTEIQFHKVTLAADGDLALIGDDWGQMQFTAGADQNAALDANSPTMTIRHVGLRA